jgi:hypothetical protein
MSSIAVPTFGDLDRYGREADAYARQYGLTGERNGDADAFRHAYASAEMTRQYNEFFAAAAGTSWEVFGTFVHGPSIDETNMDLWNNARGRELGRDSTSSQDSAERARDAVRDKSLITDPSDTRNRYYDDYSTIPINPLLGPMSFIVGNIDIFVNAATTAALNWTPPRRDPLVLDLDGNGITTSGINPAAAILFDQDGDGTKTGTGWIAAGEAIVVRDLNGNGTIDSGRELFGDNTIMQNGLRNGYIAANGFEALADLDFDAGGNADGKFDASDTAFSSVKLWKDLNQDGLSQSNELFTFADLSIESIHVKGTASNVNLGGGNTQTFSGSFTRTDGQTGCNHRSKRLKKISVNNSIQASRWYREKTSTRRPVECLQQCLARKRRRICSNSSYFGGKKWILA